jgi:hypothetical protein
MTRRSPNSPAVLKARSRLGLAVRRHPGEPSHPEVIAARRALESAKAGTYVADLAARRGVLTDEQIAALRDLLPPAPHCERWHGRPGEYCVLPPGHADRCQIQGVLLDLPAG